MSQMLPNYRDYNINTILKNKPYLNWVESYEPSMEYEVLCKREYPTLRIIRDDKRVTLHSTIDPQKEAKNWAEQVEKKVKAKYVIFGFGLGYHIRELKKLIDEDSSIYVIEPCFDIFSKAIELVDLRDILEDDKIIINVNNNNSVIIRKLRELLFDITFKFESIVLEALYPYTLLFSDIYTDITSKIGRFIKEAMCSQNTIISSANNWQENLLKNIPYIHKSYQINSLENKFKNVPAIIVSAGPSLNKNIQELKRVGDKAVIISTDTALKALYKNNIKPHFVISIDGSIKNYEKYVGLNYDDTPLVYTTKVNWNIVNNHKGKKFLFLSGDTYTEFLLNKYDIKVYGLATGGSVSNNALHFAVIMGANPIVFVGQDLAFTNDKSHADGTMYDGKNGVVLYGDEIFVKGIYGDQVRTDYSFYIFLKWFDDFIAEDTSDRRYIDSTEGGAYIEGTEVIPLADCIDTYMTINHNVSKELNVFFDREKQIDSKIDVKEVKESLYLQRDTLKDISKRCQKVCNMCDDIITTYERLQINSKKFSAFIRKMDNLDEYIRDKSKDMALLENILRPVISNAYSSSNLNARIKKYNTQKEEDIDIIGYSFHFYYGIKNAIEYTLPLIEECIDKL